VTAQVTVTTTHAGGRSRRRPVGRLGVGKLVAGLIVVAFTFFFVVPIAWLILASTKNEHQLQTGQPFALGTLHEFSANWNALVGFEGDAFAGWLGNSAEYAFTALIIVLLVSIPAGYTMALLTIRLRRVLLVTTLVVMLIPNTALVLPVFLELNHVGLIGSAWAVILPFSFFPFGVYLAYIYFSTSIPRELLAAARIDGCSELQVFTRVALPLATPIVALVAFFSFVANWNNYFLPFVMLPSSNGYPLQIGLTSLLGATPAFNPSSIGAQTIQLPTLALATLLSVTPVLLIFLFSQRFLVSGMTAGGTKE
jgi:multiple sugar transport system permease protein